MRVLSLLSFIATGFGAANAVPKSKDRANEIAIVADCQPQKAPGF
jgi:hypothetical protein